MAPGARNVDGGGGPDLLIDDYELALSDDYETDEEMRLEELLFTEAQLVEIEVCSAESSV